jgi:hypothetical protein
MHRTEPSTLDSSTLADYTGKWTETVAISDNGPSDLDYFRLTRS